MQKLKQLSEAIYKDIQHENRKLYKVYAQELMEVLIQCEENQQAHELLMIAFYNLGKLSNRYIYIHKALEFKNVGIERVKWNLQMLALASSKGSHQQAYAQACKLINHIMQLIQGLQLQNEHEMFARQVIQLLHRSKNSNINTPKTLNELQLSRKFQTDCPYVNKTFHIADIMIIEPINIKNYQQMPESKSDQAFFYYIVFLSIACFTRATEKFYCRESVDKDYHFKAIEIAGYLYSSKSTYMRFLKRTYKEHYLEHLDDIQQVDQLGQIKLRVPPDPQEIPMGLMPWEQQEKQ